MVAVPRELEVTTVVATVPGLVVRSLKRAVEAVVADCTKLRRESVKTVTLDCSPHPGGMIPRRDSVLRAAVLTVSVLVALAAGRNPARRDS